MLPGAAVWGEGKYMPLQIGMLYVTETFALDLNQDSGRYVRKIICPEMYPTAMPGFSATCDLADRL